MERKVPPRPFINAAQLQSFPHRTGHPPTFEAAPASALNEQNAPPPPPQQPHAPQTFGFPMARGPASTNANATRRGWKPGRVGGRHDSPLYEKHRKRPASSSIDSNVSWSGSEIDSVSGFGAIHSEQEQVSRLSWASSITTSEAVPSTSQQEMASTATEQHSLLFAAATSEHGTSQTFGSLGGMDVHPPKTPLGKPKHEIGGEMSATQRVRLELTAHAGSLAGSRTNSSENMFADTIASAYDEEQNGPQSCPSAFNNTRQPQFSIDKLRQLRSNELVASKLLPTRTSVNSLMGYVRELQISEATLRKQLVKTKQDTEEELMQSLSKVNKLERTMMEVERDRMLVRQKLEEQEKLIRDLSTKLKLAETAKANGSTNSGFDEMPSIAEETSLGENTEEMIISAENKRSASTSSPLSTPAASVQSAIPTVLHEQISMTSSAHAHQIQSHNRTSQFGLASPRSPNRPLWDPWASGGATPMKNLPPVFTIGSTGGDQVAASSTAVKYATCEAVTASEDYELKSVLMSPRGVKSRTEISEVDRLAQQTQHDKVKMETEDSALILDAGVAPSTPPEQQSSSLSLTQHEGYGALDQNEGSIMNTPLPDVSMHCAKPMASADQKIDDHQAQIKSSGSTAMSDGGKIIQELQEGPSLVSDRGEINISEVPARSVKSQVTSVDEASKNYSFESDSARDTPEHTSLSEVASVSAQPDDSPVLSASSPKREDGKVASLAEPVSLETLLVDFFNEVDQKRLKMATVYGKRYAGREKWLFAELTKRYGAAKVVALKDKFESMARASISSDDRSNSTIDNRTGKPSKVSDNPKSSRQGHPRHPQFLQLLTPTVDVDASAAPSSQNHNELETHTQHDVKQAAALVSSSEALSNRGAIASQRRSMGVGSSLSLSSSQKPLENEGTSEAATDSSHISEPTPAKFDNAIPATAHQAAMDEKNISSSGLRQRYHASDMSIQDQKKVLPPITLEILLEELYNHHQPDKLKNVSIVAKQYAGKERELVGLLKKKYGALSVKRLEENVELLEQAHRACVDGRNSHKKNKRGWFIRTISLVFWLSVLLYFCFGAVFVSFVIIDAWECRAFGNDEQDLEPAEECFDLENELKDFTYERIAAYFSQSYSDDCFCAVWNSRQSALFTNFSGDNIIDLAKLVPFSPDSFGTPWIASVKEYIPSQEFYETYAKPVVDLSLSVGSFVWVSVIDLSKYKLESEKKTQLGEDVENDSTGLVAVESGAYDNVEGNNEIDARDQMLYDVSSVNNVDNENEGDAKGQLPDGYEKLAAKYIQNLSEVKSGHQVPQNVEEEATINVENDSDDDSGDQLFVGSEFAASENEIEVKTGRRLPEKAEVAATGNVENGKGVEVRERLPEKGDVGKEREIDQPIGEIESADMFVRLEGDIVDESAKLYDDHLAEENLTIIDSARFLNKSDSDENYEAVTAFHVSELNKFVPLEDSELALRNGEGLVDIVSDATEILQENSANPSLVKDDDDDQFYSTSGDEKTFVISEAVERVLETASIEVKSSQEMGVEGDKFVEIEVRQEDLNLLYPVTETHVTGGNLTAAVVDDSHAALMEESPELSGDNVVASSAIVNPGVPVFESVSAVDEWSRTEGTEAELTEVDSASDALSEASSVEAANLKTSATLIEKNDVETGRSKLEAVLDVKENKSPAEAENDVIDSEVDHKPEKETIGLYPNSASLLSSYNVNMAESLLEDSSAGVSNESFMVINNGKKSEEYAVASYESFQTSLAIPDAKMDKLNSEAMDETDIDSNISSEDESSFGLTDNLTGAVAVASVEESDDDKNMVGAIVDVVSGAVTDSHGFEPRFGNEIDAVRGVDDKKDNSNTALDVSSANEVDHSVPVSENSVAIEAAKVLDDFEADAAEVARDMTDQIDIVEITGVSDTADAENSAAKDSKIANAFEIEHFEEGDDVFSVSANDVTSEIDDGIQAADIVQESEAIQSGDGVMEQIISADEITGLNDENELLTVVADESPTSGLVDGDNGGLVSAVNDVLARLVEPFEAAKATSIHAATTEEERV
ncbi:uncharacterized protein PHALS_13562 [Plasmopara halstedii]|uniref:Uncharacterized protein n=1 Tax=Plasmopara halstedii TaxID=4781 RepID=A0A0P1APK7_PLAHL|nr:uncharacterized protein PHALS_13562 [Plasmopara halstedii]CEG43362.1 hypothetical protein PHALS_13562 [Plasmopara halstedii]|eukprot:XP_024579731.1 hypothetical protein PHALS_13562 [Plasmopara halstedii]